MNSGITIRFILRNAPVLALCLCASSLIAQTVLAGNQTIGSNLDSTAAGLAEAFPVTATASGQVTSINFFLDESSTATKIYVGIYNNSGANPGSLLTQGSATQLFPGTWNSISVTAANVTSGTAYWIAILGASGKPFFYDQSTTACNSQTSSQSSLTSLPSTWSKGKTWSTCYVSAYAVAGSLPATVMIGNQLTESNLDKNSAEQAEAFPAVANTTGSVAAISLYLDPTSGSGPVYVGLYADNGKNHPGALLGQGSTSSPVAGSWNPITITPSSITAGSRYWIAVLGIQATSPYFRDRSTTICHSETSSQTNLASLPSTWTTGKSWNTCYIAAYGEPASGTPILSISPSSLSFTAVQGGANPSPASLSVTNTGTGTLSFTDSSDQPWLTVAPTSGTAPQAVQVSAAVGSLTPGTYTGHVTVTASSAQGSPAMAPVTFTVSPFVPPSISATASPIPNSNGWNNTPVTVTFTCVAGSYAIQTCPAPIVVNTQGASQPVTGTAIDVAGDHVSATVNLNIDLTAPTIQAMTTPPANSNGVNTTPVTVGFACDDSVSGVASCTPSVVVAAQGVSAVNGTATDLAGNTATTSASVNIAVPALSITPSVTPLPNSAGWNNGPVSFSFQCNGGIPPVQCPASVTLSNDGATQLVAVAAVDSLGATAPANFTVNLDQDAARAQCDVSRHWQQRQYQPGDDSRFGLGCAVWS